MIAALCPEEDAEIICSIGADTYTEWCCRLAKMYWPACIHQPSSMHRCKVCYCLEP